MVDKVVSPIEPMFFFTSCSIHRTSMADRHQLLLLLLEFPRFYSWKSWRCIPGCYFQFNRSTDLMESLCCVLKKATQDAQSV